MFIKQMEATIREFSLLQPKDHIVVGVSGGPDSIALLDGLHKLSATYDWKLTVAHVHHGLRGTEADEDASFVERLCRMRELACQIQHVNVRDYLNQRGGNTQDVARRLRYEAFASVAQKVGATKLALGHHADDQAETVLMRFLRGTGTRGLAGIPVKREWQGIEIVRPLWRTRRADIESYCDAQQLRPRRDSSNDSLDYFRNLIRLKLIPQLEEYNPQFKTGMLQLSEQLAAEEEMWENWTNESLERVVEEQDAGEWSLSTAELLKLPLALQRRVIQLILGYLSIRSWTHTEHIRALANHASPSARRSLPGGWEAVRNYGIIHIRQQEPVGKPQDYHVALNLPGVTFIPRKARARIEAIVTHNEIETDQRGMRWAVFDAEKVTGQLYVRTRQPGDRIHIKGMNGSKKVKKLFIDEKVSRDKRDWWPCVTDETDILWIPGLRRSRKALVTDETLQRIYLFYRSD